jgi:hypothetical protein
LGCDVVSTVFSTDSWGVLKIDVPLELCQLRARG